MCRALRCGAVRPAQAQAPRSKPTDETGPSTADPKTKALLNFLGLASGRTWTDAATPVLWRTAPEEVWPPDEEAFLAEVDRAVTDIPDAIRDQSKTSGPHLLHNQLTCDSAPD